MRCNGNAGVGVEEEYCDECRYDGCAGMSAGMMDGTRGSGIVSSAADMLGMSVVRGMRGVGGVCVGRRSWRGG